MVASMASAWDQTNANVSLDLQGKPVIKVCADAPERRLGFLFPSLVLWFLSSSKAVNPDVFLFM